MIEVAEVDTQEEKKRLAMVLLEFADRGDLNPDPSLMDYVRSLLRRQNGVEVHSSQSTSQEVGEEDTKILAQKLVVDVTKGSSVISTPRLPKEFPEQEPLPRPVIRVRSQEEMERELAEHDEKVRIRFGLKDSRDVRSDITAWANGQKMTLKACRHRAPEIAVALRKSGWPDITEGDVAREMNHMINGW